MSSLTLKQKIIAIVAAIGALLILIFQQGLYSKPSSNSEANQQAEPFVVSTNPSPLDESTILPNQTLEITFNRPVENKDEFKHKIDPEADIKIELSDDRKKVKIIPTSPYKLGSGYTLIVLPDTKFEGGGRLPGELIYHFKTINYDGV